MVLFAITNPEFWNAYAVYKSCIFPIGLFFLTIMLSIQLQDALISVWVMFCWLLFVPVVLDFVQTNQHWQAFLFLIRAAWLTFVLFLTFIYTTDQRFRFGRFVYAFKRSHFCSTRLHVFTKKCSKISNIIKYYYN